MDPLNRAREVVADDGYLIWEPLPTPEEEASGRKRDASAELEHALAALSDGWEREAGRRNALLRKLYLGLEKRSKVAARAYWEARADLDYRDFEWRAVLPAFVTLARLHLTRSLVLQNLPRVDLLHTLRPVASSDQPPVERARLRSEVPSPTVEQHTHPIGTEVLLLEPLGPSSWIVEVAVLAPELEGGCWFDTLTVEASALEFLTPVTEGSP